MTSQQITWDGYLMLTFSLGWEWEEDGGIISIYAPSGAGAIQISFASSHTEPSAIDVNALTKSFAEAQGFEDVRPSRTALGGIPASYFEGITKGEEPSLWRVWTVARNGRIATVSYTCSEEDRDFERTEVDGLLSGVRWLF
jgi:hypothetical protein